MNREKLLKILKNFKGKKVLVLADLILDQYIWGIPKRISREAPVLILKKKMEWAVPGGGANVVMNLKDQGAEPIPFGFLGDDQEGQFLLEFFKKREIKTDFIKILRGWKTVRKVRILAGFESTSKQQVVRYDEEVYYPKINNNDIPLKEIDCLIVSDYGYNSLDFSFLNKEKLKTPVLVDSRYRLKKFKNVTSLTPNIEEAELLVGFRISTDEEAKKASQVIIEKLNPKAVLMTMGSKGVLIHQKNKKPKIIPPYGSGQIADTTGAGDAVLATYSLSLCSGASFEEAAYLANMSGGIKVKKMGTATVSFEELKDGIEKLP
ncbi:MAG: bifunctional ADP-heptose synthase [Thermoanaerobaculia bacterium]